MENSYLSSDVEKTAIMNSSLSKILQKSKGIIPSIYTENIKKFYEMRIKQKELTIVSKKKKSIVQEKSKNLQKSENEKNFFPQNSTLKLKKFNSLIIKNPTLGGKSILEEKKKILKTPKNFKNSLPKISKVKLNVKKLKLGPQKNFKKNFKEGLKISKKDMKKLLSVFEADGFIDTSDHVIKGERRSGSLNCKIEIENLKRKKNCLIHSYRTDFEKKLKIDGINGKMVKSHRDEKKNLFQSFGLDEKKNDNEEKKMVDRQKFRSFFGKTEKKKNFFNVKKNRRFHSKPIFGKNNFRRKNLKKKKFKEAASLKIYRKKYPKREESQENDKEDSGFIEYHKPNENLKSEKKLFFCKKLKLQKFLKNSKSSKNPNFGNKRKKSENFIRVGNHGFRYFNKEKDKNSDNYNNLISLNFGIKGSKISEWDRKNFGFGTGYSNSVFNRSGGGDNAKEGSSEIKF